MLHKFFTRSSCFLLVAMLVYVGSYIFLTRTSMLIESGSHRSGFYYLPMHGEKIAANKIFGTVEKVLCQIFYPLETIDLKCFGNCRMGIPLLELSATPGYVLPANHEESNSQADHD